MDVWITDAQVWAFACAFVFMMCDILSGFLQAVVNHNVQSVKIREGLVHKASIALIIFAVYALELTANHVAGLHIDGLGTVPVCVIVILMELVSIWENVCSANPQLKNSPLGKLLESTVEMTGGDDNNDR